VAPRLCIADNQLIILFIPNSGIAAAYAEATPGMEEDAIGIFLLSWMIVTFLFL
jgi:hypothetical protein